MALGVAADTYPAPAWVVAVIEILTPAPLERGAFVREQQPGLPQHCPGIFGIARARDGAIEEPPRLRAPTVTAFVEKAVAMTLPAFAVFLFGFVEGDGAAPALECLALLPGQAAWSI